MGAQVQIALGARHMDLRGDDLGWIVGKATRRCAYAHLVRDPGQVVVAPHVRDLDHLGGAAKFSVNPGQEAGVPARPHHPLGWLFLLPIVLGRVRAEPLASVAVRRFVIRRAEWHRALKCAAAERTD